MGGVHDMMGEDVGDGSVDRRRVGGLRRTSSSVELSVGDPCTLRLGRGEGRNSSIRSVSGTGSILSEVVDALGKPDRSPRRRHGLGDVARRQLASKRDTMLRCVENSKHLKWCTSNSQVRQEANAGCSQ